MAGPNLCIFDSQSIFVHSLNRYEFAIKLFNFVLQCFSVAIDKSLKQPRILLLDVDLIFTFKSFDVLYQFLSLSLVSSVLVS